MTYKYLTKEQWYDNGDNILYPVEYTYDKDGDLVMTYFAVLNEDGNIIDSKVVYD